jgi:HlyD family secretion protein
MNATRTILQFMLIALSLFAAACGRNSEQKMQGWVEADLVFIGPDEPGRVETLAVREGDTVIAGAPLFSVDADLQKADVLSGEAMLANAEQSFMRAQELLKNKTGTQKDFDAARASYRDAEAKLNWSRTRLARRSVSAPVGGVVQQVYYRPGEVVSAGRPVIALLPPGNIKVRFYVSETTLPKIAINDTVKVTCDGCVPDLTARVSFISGSSEYTPPVIYSLEERSKLVFLIWARPDKPDALRIGQPVSVTIPAKANY